MKLLDSKELGAEFT